VASKAHICIGGPLDGQHAIGKDFWEHGMFHHLEDEYMQFNTAWRNATVLQRASKALDRPLQECHVVWLHRSLLRPSVTPRNR